MVNQHSRQVNLCSHEGEIEKEAKGKKMIKRPCILYFKVLCGVLASVGSCSCLIALCSHICGITDLHMFSSFLF